MRISIVGSGNVAFHLFKAFVNAGVSIDNVYARNPESIQAQLRPRALPLSEISKCNSDIILVALKDDAIETVLENNVFPKESFIAHTSGATSINVFSSQGFENYGVFYPLQTIKKEKEIIYQEMPIFLEANNEATIKYLQDLATKISGRVGEMNSQQRLAAHTAAVFASNFTNHMYHAAEKLLRDHQLDEKLLHPLIQETTEKALSNGASEAQTGPAIRRDRKTMEKHIELIEDKNLQQVYKAVSVSIQKLNPKKQ